MAAISTMIAAAGLGLAAAGAGMQYVGAKKQQAAMNQMAAAQEARDQAQIAAQERAEQLRQQQMNLDASRRKREIIRQTMAARAAALAVTTAQGAAAPGGSALPGSYAAVSGQSNTNMLGVSQNQQIGQSMFDNNRNLFGAYRSYAANASNYSRAAASAGTFGSMGSGLSSLGGAIMRSSDTIGRVGTYIAGQFGGGSVAASSTSYSKY